MEADDLIARLRAHDVPVGLINTAPDLLTDPHIAARDMIQRLAAGFAADVPMTGVVPKFSRTPGEIRTVGPALGEHTDAVLRDLARFSDEEIARLRDAGVVA
jgi:crotonobetainyl-CoA:carnitine CoA-transferase CaiB-like acyl-CoA transferase